MQPSISDIMGSGSTVQQRTSIAHFQSLSSTGDAFQPMPSEEAYTGTSASREVPRPSSLGEPSITVPGHESANAPRPNRDVFASSGAPSYADVAISGTNNTPVNSYDIPYGTILLRFEGDVYGVISFVLANHDRLTLP